MENIDIERLHRDCLKWCENPTWKPWQDGWTLKKEGVWFRIIKKNAASACARLITGIDSCGNKHDQEREYPHICEFAHLIGLAVESYRKDAQPEVDELEAYLLRNGFQQGDAGNKWRKGELRIWNGGDGCWFAKFRNRNIPMRLPSMPFVPWVQSTEKLISEPKSVYITAPSQPTTEEAHAMLDRVEREHLQKVAKENQALRLECLKLAVTNGPGRSAEAQENEAQRFMDWITKDAPEITTKAKAQIVGIDPAKKGGDFTATHVLNLPTNEHLQEQLQRAKAQIVPEPTPEENPLTRPMLLGDGWMNTGAKNEWDGHGVRIIFFIPAPYTTRMLNIIKGDFAQTIAAPTTIAALHGALDSFHLLRLASEVGGSNSPIPAPLDPPTADNLEGRREFLKGLGWQCLFEKSTMFLPGTSAMIDLRADGHFFKLNSKSPAYGQVIAEQPFQDWATEITTKAKAQIVTEPTPEEVLAANGWAKNSKGMYEDKEFAGIFVWYLVGECRWHMSRLPYDGVTPFRIWDKTDTFPNWMMDALVKLAAGKVEAEPDLEKIEWAILENEKGRISLAWQHYEIEFDEKNHIWAIWGLTPSGRERYMNEDEVHEAQAWCVRHSGRVEAFKQFTPGN